MQIVSCKGRLYVCIRNSTQYLPCILLISMDKGSALAKVAAGGENIFTTRLFPNECSGSTLQSTACSAVMNVFHICEHQCRPGGRIEPDRQIAMSVKIRHGMQYKDRHYKVKSVRLRF